MPDVDHASEGFEYQQSRPLPEVEGGAEVSQQVFSAYTQLEALGAQGKPSEQVMMDAPDGSEWNGTAADGKMWNMKKNGNSFEVTTTAVQ